MKYPTEAELKATVTIRKRFFELTQDINAALLLSQLHYWSKRTTNPERWIYKTQEELQEEIFLTPYQQRRARKILIAIQLIEEKCIGLPKKLHFRIKYDATKDDEFENQVDRNDEVNNMQSADMNSKDIGYEGSVFNSEETSLIEIEKLDHNEIDTSLIDSHKYDRNDEETSLHTNITETITKTTPKITTLSVRNNGFANINSSIISQTPEQAIFEHWKITMTHPHAKIDKTRSKLIKEALKLGYGVDDLCRAISGCAVTPHNMGINDKRQRYDGLHIILKNADQIDRFIGNYLNPPRQKTKSDLLADGNINVAHQWLTGNKDDSNERF